MFLKIPGASFDEFFDEKITWRRRPSRPIVFWFMGDTLTTSSLATCSHMTQHALMEQAVIAHFFSDHDCKNIYFFNWVSSNICYNALTEEALIAHYVSDWLHFFP